MFLSKPYASVADRKADQLTILIFLLDARLDDNFAALGKFNSVVAKVDQYLSQAKWVPFELRRDRGIDVEDQFQSFGARFLGDQIANVLQHFLQIEINVFDRQFPGFDLPLLTYISYRDIVSKVPPWLCKWSAMPVFSICTSGPEEESDDATFT